MENLTKVESHNEVNSGDVLVHIEQNNVTNTYKVETSDLMGTLLNLVKQHALDIPKTVITFVEYGSPLKQKLIKIITIEK